MLTSAADLSAQLEALNSAILTVSASPEASTTFNGQTITNADLGRLIEARRQLETDYAAATRSGGARRVRLRRL